MQKIKIQAVLDADNADHIEAAVTFLRALNPASGYAQKLQDDVEEKPKRTRRTKAEIAKDTEAENTEAENTEAKNTDNPGVTIEEVRLKLAEKVAAHRDPIKAKLLELGAKNVSTMSPDKYGVFVDFLNSL